MHAMDEHGDWKDRYVHGQKYVTDKQTLNFEKRAAAGKHRNRRRNEVLPSAPRCDSIMPHGMRHPPTHRKIIRRAAQISFFSCLLLSVASSNINNNVELKECTAPRVANNYFNQFNKRKSFSPREVAQLGDGRRSSEASGSFFDFLDRDGDGSLGTEEVALFLRDQIGGSQFDTQSEVDNEVETVMERLDKNDNNELEMSDILDYWMQLESLLTAEEVRDWIVYSVQLPKSVGEIFLENGITGYDFLEIIENGGDILRDELGIEKSSFINKIVKRIQARMLGIGSVPGSPKQFEHKFVSCKTVSFSWSRCTARVFPVHSYRIQRREINLFEHASTNNDNYSGLNLDMSLSLVSQPLSSDWKTVYVGGENEFVDSSLKMGHNYMYRIQAWNSVGRSGWETIDLTQILKKQRCSTKPHHSMMQSGTQSPRNVNFVDVDQWELLSIPKRLISGIIILFQLFFSFVRGFFAVIAMGTAIMRYRRASATSSASATTILPFPWFWTGINRLSVKITGNECIPRTMLGDKEALKRQETLHDERVGATGLRGYAQAKKKTSHCDDNEAEKSNSSGRRNANRDSFDKRLEFGRQKSNSTGNLLSIAEVRSPFEGPRNFFTNTRQRRLRTLETVSSLSGGEVDSESVGKSNSQGSFESLLNSKSDHQTLSRCRSDIDDGFRCIECEKKFKFGKRWKHHCSRCMSTFCHKHGRTTHNNFTSCKVPGSCLCNPCLKLLKTRDHASRQKGSDFTL